MKTLCRLLAALFLLALMPGCASTPAQRIAQNQELFDSFPVADQARIRGGQIDLGYSPDMVRIALGTPQQGIHGMPEPRQPGHAPAVGFWTGGWRSPSVVARWPR